MTRLQQPRRVAAIIHLRLPGPNTMPEELIDQAAEVRELAKRARRFADQLTAAADRARLLRYAEELETQAADLERRASGGTG